MAILFELYTNHGKIVCVESSIEYQYSQVYGMQHMYIYFNVNEYSNSRPQYQLLSGEIYLLQIQNCTMKRAEQGFIMMLMQNLKPILLVNTMIAIAASQSQFFLAAIHLSSCQTYYYSLAQIFVFSYVFTTLYTMQLNTVS